MVILKCKFNNALLFLFLINSLSLLSLADNQAYKVIDTKPRSLFEHKDYINRLTKTSYNEVSSHINKNFNHRCILALQNCLFQTQWENLFETKHLNEHAYSDSNLPAYLYCKAFLVAQFCVDHHLKTLPYHTECIEDTNENSPSEFKLSIYRDECRQYYSHFMQSRTSDAICFFRYSNLAFFKQFLLYMFIYLVSCDCFK